MTLQIAAFAARPPRLPPEGFLEKGAWVLLGEVVEFQVSRQEANFEYGNVVIRVDEVLEGKVNSALVSFPYGRQIRVGFNPTDWSIAARPEVGKKYIIFFGEAVDGWGRKRNDGMYSLSRSGANPIQEVSSYDDLEVIKLREAIRLHHLPK